MPKITAYNLVRAISQLPRNVNYNYVNQKTKGLIHIENVSLPAGPIYFRRWNPFKGETQAKAAVETMSSEMIWRVANAINVGDPINIDRILGASYNTRSVLEALMAATPEFYYCYPGRISDFEWCFDGLPENSSIAITTNGCMSSPYGKRMLLRGVEELQKQKAPTNLIVCGRHVDEMDVYDNVHYYPSFSQRWKERAV